MTDCYIIEGGIGKAVCFSALIPSLSKDGKIKIYTPYADVFAGNPGVEMVYDSSSIPLFDPRIINSNIIYREVYKSNFIRKDHHIIEAMCNDYGIDYTEDMSPELFTAGRHDDLPTGGYCLIQFTGGQSALTGGEGQYDSIDAGRNLHPSTAQEVINGIHEMGIKVIDFSLPNEPAYDNTEKVLRPFSWYYEALKGAKFHVCIDSCLNHFSGGTDTNGVVLWYSTDPVQFGYDNNTNLKMTHPNYLDSGVILDSIKRLR